MFSFYKAYMFENIYMHMLLCIFWLNSLFCFILACYYCTTKYIELKEKPGSDAKFKITFDFKSYLALRDTWLAFGMYLIYYVNYCDYCCYYEQTSLYVHFLLKSRAVYYLITSTLYWKQRWKLFCFQSTFFLSSKFQSTFLCF